MTSASRIRRIGVFDSGVGGITVLQSLRARFPALEVVYLGDTANVPYGTKSPAQIEKLSRYCAGLLKAQGIQALVVACNTASSLALPAIREEVGADIEVIGMVEPGVASVMEKCRNTAGPILLLATRATVRSGAYRHAFQAALTQSLDSREILEQSCPLLVPMIEEGWLSHPILSATIDEYIRPHLASPTGVALLGCTHYPWIRSVIASRMPGWEVVDSAEATASYFAQKLANHLSPGVATSGTRGAIQWIFTDPVAVPAFARNLMQVLA